MALVQATFPSYSLGRSVTFSALIPTERGFRLGEETKFSAGQFKTLYMLHGFSGQQNDFLLMTDIWRFSGALGLAIIFPSGENSFYLEDEDLGTSHSRYVGKELVDFTRSMFPLSDRREDTFIGGISMGAYGALINALRNPDTFSRVLAMSGAFIGLEIADRMTTCPDDISDSAFQKRVFGDPRLLRHSDKDPRFLMEQLLKQGKTLPRIRQCCGADDFLLGVNRKLHQFMGDNGIEHHYEEGPGVHDWDYWQKRLEPGLEWLVGG